MMRLPAAALVLLLAAPSLAGARSVEQPIRLSWAEGELSGLSFIYGPDGEKRIGTIVFHQTREGDVITATRVARFADGSSDEDVAVARAGKTLETIRGRSIIRDTRGREVVDLDIDVRGGRLKGFYTDDGKRTDVDEKVELPPSTYFGPLIFLVVKSFEANAEDGHVVFRTVAVTPKPRVLDMEVVPDGEATVARPGIRVPTRRFALRPKVFFLIDPLIRKFVPETTFFVESGKPPAMARYAGPRNYAGQRIVLE